MRVAERLLQAVDLRMGSGLPTIYTSNLSFDLLATLLTSLPDDFARIRGERVVERIREHCGQKMVAVGGANLRRGWKA